MTIFVISRLTFLHSKDSEMVYVYVFVAMLHTTYDGKLSACMGACVLLIVNKILGINKEYKRVGECYPELCS